MAETPQEDRDRLAENVSSAAPVPLPAFSPEASAAAPAEEAKPAMPKPKDPSVGEKWWHRITYGGFGYLANLAVSVVLWDFFMSGRGAPVYRGIRRGASAVLKTGGASADYAEHIGGAVAKYTFSPLGGHVTMVPVKMAEDHARYITHRLNQALDPDYKYKDIQADWNTPEENLPPLSDEPTRNTWSQVAMRRGLGWLSVIASGTALRATHLEKPLEDWTIKSMNRSVDLTGSAALKRLSQTPRAQRYVQLAALDSYLTGVTTFVTAITKKTFGTSRDNTIPDDALSIDIPGLTELHDGNGYGKRNGHGHHTPQEEKTETQTTHADAALHRPAIAPRHQSGGFVESHNARQQAAENEPAVIR